jgi:hypothetical protein
VDAYTVAAPDAIAAFAVPNPGSSSRGSRFFRVWWLSELPRHPDHPAYFGSVSVTGPILSTVDTLTLLLPTPECSDVDHKSHLGGAKLAIAMEKRLRTEAGFVSRLAGNGFWFDHVACFYLSLWYIHAGQRFGFKRTHQLKPVVYLINQKHLREDVFLMPNQALQQRCGSKVG